MTVPFLFVQLYAMPTSSMEPTILAGDRLLVQRFPKPAVQRDGIIVFRYPANAQVVYIKRAVGLPGDRIRIINKRVYRNGSLLAEPYTVHCFKEVEPYRDNFPAEPNGPLQDGGQQMLSESVVNGEVLVPSGKYFVLGDIETTHWIAATGASSTTPIHRQARVDLRFQGGCGRRDNGWQGTVGPVVQVALAGTEPGLSPLDWVRKAGFLRGSDRSRFGAFPHRRCCQGETPAPSDGR